MSAWIEERGVVVAADADWATVRMQRQSTCGSCSARSGCGNGVLAEVLGRRVLEFRLANADDLRPGDRVTLGIHDRALVSGALIMYLLPLLGLIATPVVLGWMLPGVPEGGRILAGVGGFALGLIAVRRWLRDRGQRFEPVLLGREPAGTIATRPDAGTGAPARNP
jgi:sigma-E factor negative regulatory protein RseC